MGGFGIYSILLTLPLLFVMVVELGIGEMDQKRKMRLRRCGLIGWREQVERDTITDGGYLRKRVDKRLRGRFDHSRKWRWG